MTVQEATSQLDTARAAQADAQTAVDIATAAFDRTGKDPELDKLATAKVKLSAAAERVARAERLLAAAQQAEAADAQRAKEAEIAQLSHDISRENVATLMGPHHARLREQALALVDTFEQICDIRRGLERKETRYQGLTGTAGMSSMSSVPLIDPKIEEALNDTRNKEQGDSTGFFRNRILADVQRAFRDLLKYAR